MPKRQPVGAGPFDSTVIDAMPAADRTYEEADKDIRLKMDAMFKQSEQAEGATS